MLARCNAAVACSMFVDFDVLVFRVTYFMPGHIYLGIKASNESGQWRRGDDNSVGIRFFLR